jgi:hypothetical protein
VQSPRGIKGYFELRAQSNAGRYNDFLNRNLSLNVFLCRSYTDFSIESTFKFRKGIRMI